MATLKLPVRVATVMVAGSMLVGCAGGGDDPVVAASTTGLAVTTTDEVPATGSTSTPTTEPPVATTTSAPAPTVETDRCPTAPAPPAPDPDRPRYRVTVAADPVSGVVTGTLQVRFTPDLPVEIAVFRTWANGPRPASVGTSIEVDDIRVDGGPTGVERPDPTTVVVGLGRRVGPGEPVSMSMSWRLEVGGPVDDRISRQGESLRLGSFLPMLAWEPGVGWAREPPTSGFAEATSSPVADWDVELTVPDGFDAVVSGLPAGESRWRAEATRDIAVAVGRFARTTATAMAPHPVEVTVAVHDGADDAARYLDRIVRSLEAFAAWFGPYPWPVYQLSITPSLGGGIEFPMHVLQGPGTDGRTTPHEVAHMWFYGLVGNNQGRDPWLDEGLATYAEARFEGTVADLSSRSVPPAGAGRAGEPMTYWERNPGAYYRAVYVQPAAVLSRLGDPALVDCALRYFVAENAHEVATPADLYRALDATFADWRPTLATAGLG